MKISSVLTTLPFLGFVAASALPIVSPRTGMEESKIEGAASPFALSKRFPPRVSPTVPLWKLQPEPVVSWKNKPSESVLPKETRQEWEKLACAGAKKAGCSRVEIMGLPQQGKNGRYLDGQHVRIKGDSDDHHDIRLWDNGMMDYKTHPSAPDEDTRLLTVGPAIGSGPSEQSPPSTSSAAGRVPHVRLTPAQLAQASPVSLAKSRTEGS